MEKIEISKEINDILENSKKKIHRKRNWTYEEIKAIWIVYNSNDYNKEKFSRMIGTTLRQTKNMYEEMLSYTKVNNMTEMTDEDLTILTKEFNEKG